MRVYLPSTASGLARALEEQVLQAPVHTVTPAMREWYLEGDQEELEFAAFTEAAEGSLRLLAGTGGSGEGGEPARRVVLAADVPDATVASWPDAPSRSLARLLAPVAWASVVSVHVDEEAAEAAVRAAVAALPAADAGDDDAQFAVDEAQACDLLWFDVTEAPDVLRDLRHRR